MKPFTKLFLLLFSSCLHAADTHLVTKGDTLHRIARRHGCTVTAIQDANGLSGDLIRIGQNLILPSTVTTETRTQAVHAKAPDSVALPAPITLQARLKGLPAPDLMKVQLLLDRELFPPGKVDGLAGEFTAKAAERWIAAKAGRDIHALVSEARQKITTTQFAFTIPATAAKHIGTVPVELKEKAAAKVLPYETLAEYTAERFHTDLSTLRRLNPSLDLAALKIGGTLMVPAVTPFLIETWPQAGVSSQKAHGGLHLRICHDERMIEVVHETGMLRAAFPITVSPKPEHRRGGEWFIRSIAANPSFVWDDELLKKGVKGKKQHLLPPGPNNPVGVLWLEIEPVNGPEAHIGIHGTADPARIGRSHSSGCIRLANWDIVRLAKLVGRGTRVSWSVPAVPESPSLALASQP